MHGPLVGSADFKSVVPYLKVRQVGSIPTRLRHFFPLKTLKKPLFKEIRYSLVLYYKKRVAKYYQMTATTKSCGFVWHSYLIKNN